MTFKNGVQPRNHFQKEDAKKFLIVKRPFLRIFILLGIVHMIKIDSHAVCRPYTTHTHVHKHTFSLIPSFFNTHTHTHTHRERDKNTYIHTYRFLQMFTPLSIFLDQSLFSLG